MLTGRLVWHKKKPLADTKKYSFIYKSEEAFISLAISLQDKKLCSVKFSIFKAAPSISVNKLAWSWPSFVKDQLIHFVIKSNKNIWWYFIWKIATETFCYLKRCERLLSVDYPRTTPSTGISQLHQYTKKLQLENV